MLQTRHLRLAVIAAAAILLVAQWVGTALLVSRAREAAMTAATDTVQRVSRAVEASINRNFVQIDAVLAGLPAILSPMAGNAPPSDEMLTRVLRELNNQNFTFRDILLIGENGMPMATGLPVSRRRPLPLPRQNAFVETVGASGSVLIGGPVRNPVTSEWSLYLARRVSLTGIGPVLAVAEVPVSVVTSLLSASGDGPGLRVTLEREDGTLLASVPHDEARIGSRLPVPAINFRSSEAQTVRAQDTRFGDDEVFIAVRPTLYPSLSVATSLRIDEALSGWVLDRNRAIYASAAFGVLVALLAVALLLWLRQREAAETERQRWRATLENALESMSDGFVMFDENDRLVACNTRYKDFYAVSAPFIVPGAKFDDIIREGALRGQYPQAGDDIDAFVAETRQWHRSDEPPMERLLPDGRWVLVTERRTPDGGTVGIRTDITPIKQAMEELAAARDAASAAGEAKSRFLARMSHELRTPLNSVLGFAELLLRDPRLTPQQREQVLTLHDAGRHLLDLVNGLLDLAKIESGRMELVVRTVALRPLLESCAALFSPECDRKGILLRRDLAVDLPEAVEADPTRLRQMMLNLLSNAVKFTPSGGIVDLRARNLPDGRLRLEVQDTGPGVPAEKRHMLFEDFVQLAPALETGTGLGLAISARLASLMGGQIGCDSEPGNGALFWVELPLPLAVLPIEDALPARPALARPLRVLVVDDVAANRLVARAMLASGGHQVALANDGAEAVAAVEAGDFDVVLMDLQMPGMDGLTATRHIRALPGPKGRIPVLAVTASALPDQVSACHEAGMDGHLAKPIEREALLASVARLAKGAQQIEAQQRRLNASQNELPVLDETALDRLIGDIGPGAEAILVEFLGELRLGLQVLEEAEAAHDPQRLRPVVHRVIGAARSVGAMRFGQAAEALQAAIHAGRPVEPLVGSVITIGRESLPALEAWIDRYRGRQNPRDAMRLGSA
ncbi:response regulator [Acetobacteraceae bacterium H6797]|nr:response regulator [Acetobacteraceae bacterium H6797]